MDLQLAQTHTAQRRMSSGHGIVGYRRVLTGSENCALCAIASTQRYHRGSLMPIHDHCDCLVAPIYGEHDPGRVINEGLMSSVRASIDEHYGQAGWERPSKPMRDIRVRTHGEYGPTLTWERQNFRGPSDI